MACRRAAFVLLAAALAGSGAAAPPQWPTYPVAEAPAAFGPFVQRGDLLIVSLHVALQQELRRAVDERGAEGALAACHVDVSGVAYRMARREGVTAGRTAARLRSAANAPKPWAAPIVSRYADARASDVDGFVVDLGDRVGLLRPIAEQAICTPCHGPASELNEGVRTRVAGRYPADRAVGFDEGALRGWFWVEIPKARVRQP
jgi:hypothetical protein